MHKCLQGLASESDIAIALYGSGRGEGPEMVLNALAWFALEEVGHAFLVGFERD